MPRSSCRLGIILGSLFFSGSHGEVTQCLKDTYGMAGATWSEPFERGVEKLRCEFEDSDPATLEKFTLNYYPSIQAFADWNGTDMNPERHDEYPKLVTPLRANLEAWIPGVNGPPQTEKPKLQSCSIPADDGGGYIIQRVGPLVSIGNYDYWQYGWQDVWGLSKILPNHPEGIMFSAAFTGPVLPSGEVLAHPPIHIHHIHITPQPGVVTKMDGMLCATGYDPEQCYVVNLAVEQHGDYQCTEADGGIECFFERSVDGYAKALYTPVDLEGELNDVRAPNSPPMTWYYQVVLRWHPMTTKFKPISQHFHTGPGQVKAEDQRHNVLVFPVRAQESNFYWYSGRMEYDAEMKRNKLHAHNTLFHSAFWFNALPEELGLDDPKFMPMKTYYPYILSELGYDNFDQTSTFIFDNLARAAERHDVKCAGISNPEEKAECNRKRPGLVCQSWVQNEDAVDPVSKKTFAYDRRAPCCCRPWSFKKGDPFTVVSYMSPMKTPPGPHSPDTIPVTGNMHIHWVMSFDTMDNRSHYHHSSYVQNPRRQVTMGDGSDRGTKWPMMDLMQHFNQVAPDGDTGQFSNQEPLYDKNSFTWLFLWNTAAFMFAWQYGLLWQYDKTRMICIGLPSILCWAWFWKSCICFCRRRIKRAKDHPVVKCAQATPCCPDGATKVAIGAVKYTEVVQHDD